MDPWCFYCRAPVDSRSRCPNNVSEIHKLIDHDEAASDQKILTATSFDGALTPQPFLALMRA